MKEHSTEELTDLHKFLIPAREIRQGSETFAERDNLILVPSNNVEALQAAFAKADEEATSSKSMSIEPVQGEGNPGQCIDRDFYDEARRLTNEHGSMLIVDSIQAGIEDRVLYQLWTMKDSGAEGPI